MKKITNNVSFGKYAILVNLLIMGMFIVSMIVLLKYDKLHVKLVNDTPQYNQAESELRKVEEPRRKAQAEVDFYVNKLNTQNQQEIPADKKKAKEHAEEIEKTINTLEHKKEELAKIDAAIDRQNILFEAIQVPFDDLKAQVNSSKSGFKLTLWITILLFVVKVFFFAFWNFNSLQNLRITSPWMKKSTAPYWAYLGWIIPGYNLIKPYSVYSEVFNETHDILADKNIVKQDSDTGIDFNLGIWWGLFLITVVLFSFILSSTFFALGPMYYKLSHQGVAITAIFLWAIYIFQECMVIRKGVKMNQVLFVNRSKFDQ